MFIEGARLIGLEQVMKNLRDITHQYYPEASYRALILCAAYIRRQTETLAPVTPVDLGNLRASWLVVTGKGSVLGGEAKMEAKSFKGPKAGEIQADYQSAVLSSQGLARWNESGEKKFIAFGYGAGYAAAVHEMIGANFKRPGSGPKWFETHLKRSTKQMLQIMRTELQVSKIKPYRFQKLKLKS